MILSVVETRTERTPGTDQTKRLGPVCVTYTATVQASPRSRIVESSETPCPLEAVHFAIRLVLCRLARQAHRVRGARAINNAKGTDEALS